MLSEYESFKSRSTHTHLDHSPLPALGVQDVNIVEPFLVFRASKHKDSLWVGVVDGCVATPGLRGRTLGQSLCCHPGQVLCGTESIDFYQVGRETWFCFNRSSEETDLCRASTWDLCRTASWLPVLQSGLLSECRWDTESGPICLTGSLARLHKNQRFDISSVKSLQYSLSPTLSLQLNNKCYPQMLNLFLFILTSWLLPTNTWMGRGLCMVTHPSLCTLYFSPPERNEQNTSICELEWAMCFKLTDWGTKEWTNMTKK